MHLHGVWAQGVYEGLKADGPKQGAERKAAHEKREGVGHGMAEPRLTERQSLMHEAHDVCAACQCAGGAAHCERPRCAKQAP